LPVAIDELADLWVNSLDRQAIRRAARDDLPVN